MSKFIKLSTRGLEVHVSVDKIATIMAVDPVKGFFSPAASIISFGASDDADLPVLETAEQIFALINGAA